MQQPENIIAAQRMKQVGPLTSSKRGQLVTVVYAVNAAGSVVPPLLTFPWENYRDYFIKSGPAGCVEGANSSGWINEDLFVTYLKHFTAYTRYSNEKKVLLILDNHKTIDLAKKNGVILFTIPPRTSHKL
ncbi:uncharacterized protein LOC115228071 [Octopus sinensis]|uniref:Uncharacterized protein LOC115228071 n=1 Tax=Octopus sinensis TaxID=2607531 RepID=A0A6P7U012_9MOLL|nr:uncharacterized protein LOC115228071 [Octopus sinensis]